MGIIRFMLIVELITDRKATKKPAHRPPENKYYDRKNKYYDRDSCRCDRIFCRSTCFYESSARGVLSRCGVENPCGREAERANCRIFGGGA